MHVDDVRLGIEVKVSDVLQKHGAGGDLTGVAHQILEKLEFAWLQLDLLSSAGHPPGQQVELQVGFSGIGSRLSLAPIVRRVRGRLLSRTSSIAHRLWGRDDP